MVPGIGGADQGGRRYVSRAEAAGNERAPPDGLRRGLSSLPCAGYFATTIRFDCDSPDSVVSR